MEDINVEETQNDIIINDNIRFSKFRNFLSVH